MQQSACQAPRASQPRRRGSRGPTALAYNPTVPISGLVESTGTRREEVLRANESLYQSLTEHSGVGIWQLSMPDGRTLYMNPAMRAMLEIADGEGVDGITYDRFLTPDGRQRMEAELAKRRKGVASQYEVELVGLRGGTRAVLVSGAPVMGPDGTLQSIVGTFTDIS